MTEPSLSQLEREVEAARAKLAQDLSTLRSPATSAEFTESLKQDALETKDALLEKAKSTVQASVESLIEDIKGRAAANPTAVLAIGAGVAWRLIRHPPIATALIGAGLLSLFRTTPAHLSGRPTGEYLSYAKNRLVEQASDIADAAKEQAASVSGAVSERVSDVAGDLKDQVQDWAEQGTAAARQAVGAAKVHATEMADALETRTVQTVQPEAESLDRLLLGAAGVAVVAALGIACQRRLAETVE